MSDEQPILITGCGWVTPFASGCARDVVAALRKLPADIAPCVASPAPPTDRFLSVPGADLQAFPDIPKEIRSDKGAWMTAVAIEFALRDAGLDRKSIPPERLGLVLGCALAGQIGMIQFAGEVREQSPRFVSPINFPQTVGNFIAGAIARGYDVRGPNLTLAAGTASGLDAVCEGCSLLQAGRADVLLAGGTDALTDTLVSAVYSRDRDPAFHASAGTHVSSSTGSACGMGDGAVNADRSHEVDAQSWKGALAEGACWFVLERADSVLTRGGRGIATMEGWTRRSVRQALSPGDACRPATQPTVTSTAGTRLPAAAWIQERIGLCLGAAGASALAVALADDQGGNLSARVLAGDERSHQTCVDLQRRSH